MLSKIWWCNHSFSYLCDVQIQLISILLSLAHITLCVFFTLRWLFILTQAKHKCNANSSTYITL